MLRNWRQVHRTVGKTYVFIVLFISGPAAFCMSLYGNGGWPARISFLLLSMWWWWFTFTAYRKIRSGDVAGHRDFMIRSYALTFSAITLRVFQLLLGYFTSTDPVEGYVLVAWASWLLNLAVAEGVIWRLNKQKTVVLAVNMPS